MSRYGLFAHRAREHMREQKEHALRQPRVLLVQAADEADEGLSTVICREHAGGIFARHRVDGVFFESGGEKTAMKVEYG